MVIVGAGFGGLACARALAGTATDVLLIDRHNYHLFTPLLYQVASSLLNPSDIAYPIRAVFRGVKNVHVRVAEVRRVDLERGLLDVNDGTASTEVPYDYLVFAAGSTTNFFGNDAIERSAHGLKDLPEAMELRNHVLRCFEAASRVPEGATRLPWMTFVVVGGGPTGVEYAGALSELVRLVLVKDFPELDMGRLRIILVEARDELLSQFPKELGADARRRLEQRGIEVRLKTLVTSAAADVIGLSDGTTIDARTLVWAAGVRPADLTGAVGVPSAKNGRLVVDQHLRVAGQERVFILGDAAHVEQDGTEIPMLSAPAMQEGRYVARMILALQRGRRLKPFHYRDKGIMATIGRNAAVAVLGPLRLTGLIGWLVWLLVHLYYIIGFRNRIVVLVDWAWDYVRYDRPIRLIERARD